MSYGEKAAANALAIAADNSKGYVWGGWGPDGYDCGHLIIIAYQQAGLGLRTAGASYTGNLRRAMLACGGSDVTAAVDLNTGAGLQVGDICLKEASHAVMYVGGGRIVQARSDYDGRPGDSSGREIAVGPYYNWTLGGWDCILRPPGGSAPAAPQRPVSASDGTTPDTYTVQRGDTLSTIAGRYGVTVSSLARLNGIRNPDVIRVGQVLRLSQSEDIRENGTSTEVADAAPSVPPVSKPLSTVENGMRIYTVQRGDSLWSIAARVLGSGARCIELVQLNNIKNADRIYAGQVLRLPAE